MGRFQSHCDDSGRAGVSAARRRRLPAGAEAKLIAGLVRMSWSDLPSSLQAERRGVVAVLRLNRADKRNALNDPMVAGIETFFSTLPDDIRVVVLCGQGAHFSAGLDLTELVDRKTFAGVEHSTACNSAACRSSPCCTARWSAAALSSPRQHMCASPSAMPFTRCQKAAAASIWAAAARCDCRR